MYYILTIKPLRIITIVLLLIFFSLLFINQHYLTIPSNSSTMIFKVVIDPGHGGIDTGASYGNLLEKDINLAIAKYLYEELKKVNIIPIMTRTEDKLYQNSRNKDLRQRPLIANDAKADLFISIHGNNYPSSQPSGSQIFYKINSPESERLAEFVQKELVKLRKENNRALKKGDYYVLNMIKCPGILIETGFLSNPADRSFLSDPAYQKKIALGIKNGIVNYFQENFNKPSLEENPVHELLKNDISVSEENSLYYISFSDQELFLTGVKMPFPTASFFEKEYLTLDFKEILAISAIKELMSPPPGLISPIPDGTRINSLRIQDGLAIVDFTINPEKINAGAEFEHFSLQAILKTLFSINGIKGVKILLSGEENASTGGHIIFYSIYYK
ncbi:MAG: hypothetical protein GX175_10255 [Halanaerobiaceae bacterium]|nr:hypothetical protein [Halanaerobiaceae bacterium]